MDSREIALLRCSLPKNIRIKKNLADLEGHSQLMVDLPNYYVFDAVSGRKFFGRIKTWTRIAFVEEHWPFEAEDLINVIDDDYFEILQTAVEKANLSHKVSVISLVNI